MAAQRDKGVKSGYWILADLHRGIEQEVVKQLYKALVRTKLRFSMQFWLPRWKDMKTLQRRFTNMFSGLEYFSCEEKQYRLGLYCLQWRRLRGHLIKVYKIVRVNDSVDSEKLSPILEPFSLRFGRTGRDARRMFYLNEESGVGSTVLE